MTRHVEFVTEEAALTFKAHVDALMGPPDLDVSTRGGLAIDPSTYAKILSRVAVEKHMVDARSSVVVDDAIEAALNGTYTFTDRQEPWQPLSAEALARKSG